MTGRGRPPSVYWPFDAVALYRICRDPDLVDDLISMRRQDARDAESHGDDYRWPPLGEFALHEFTLARTYSKTNAPGAAKLPYYSRYVRMLRAASGSLRQFNLDWAPDPDHPNEPAVPRSTAVGKWPRAKARRKFLGNLLDRKALEAWKMVILKHRPAKWETVYRHYRRYNPGPPLTAKEGSRSSRMYRAAAIADLRNTIETQHAMYRACREAISGTRQTFGIDGINEWTREHAQEFLREIVQIERSKKDPCAEYGINEKTYSKISDRLDEWERSSRGGEPLHDNDLVGYSGQ